MFRIDLYAAGFSLYSFWGLCITYLYFQIPLKMIAKMIAKVKTGFGLGMAQNP